MTTDPLTPLIDTLAAIRARRSDDRFARAHRIHKSEALRAIPEGSTDTRKATP